MSYLQDRMKRKNGLLPALQTKKDCKPIAKQSQKKKQQLIEQRNSGDNKLDLWFEERRLEMTGKCVLCGGKTEKKNDETYRRSIHHLLDKRKNMFPSLAIHPCNWLEVCFWNNSCHQNIHNGTISWELIFDSKEWAIIKAKLLILLPLCTIEERKNKIYSKLMSLIYGQDNNLDKGKENG